MSVLAPAWALGAQAIDASGNSHLAQGVHYRIAPHWRLGLPLAPLLVYRLNLGPYAKHHGVRTDVRWVDSQQRVLTPPFDVTPDNPVTGYLPIGATTRCCWVRVWAEPAKRKVPVFDGGLADRLINPNLIEPNPIRPNPIRPNPIRPTPLEPTPLEPGLIGRDLINPSALKPNLLAGKPIANLIAEREKAVTTVEPQKVLEHEVVAEANLIDIRDLIHPRDLIAELGRGINWKLLQYALHVDAWRSTPRGLQVIGTRDRQPYDLGASDIHGVVVRGTGRVTGLQWIDWSKFSINRKLEPWRILPLPIPSGSRYVNVSNGPQRAREAVERGAPTRLGMHDRPDAASPSACPSATQADETARLGALAPETMTLIDALINDTSARPSDLMRTQEVGTTLDGTPTTATYPALASLMMGAADTTIARWIGLLDRDEAPPGTTNDIVVYLIRGFWAVDLRNMIPQEITRWAELYTAYHNGGAVTPATPLEGLPFEPLRTSVDEFPIFDMFIPAITTLGAPPLEPQRPHVGPPMPATIGDSTTPVALDNLGHWNPDYEAPDARREIELPVSELLPLAGLATARLDSTGTTGLNRTFPVVGSVGQRARSLIPTLPSDADAPNVGRVHDRHAPPESVRYRIAQHDWFGRWSPWTTRDVPEKSRPRPPAPVARGDYAMAPIPVPDHDAPLWGRLTARVRVPSYDSLPTGARLLASLQISGTVREPAGPAFALSHAPITLPSNPSAWPEELAVELSVAGTNLLPRLGRATARFTAVWVDTAGQSSDPSAEVAVECVDRRPPTPVVIDPTLRYSARPDAVGRARVTLSWNVAPGQHRFRVYFSDETRLIDRIRKIAAGEDPLPTPDTPPALPTTSERTLAQQLLAAWEAAGDNPAARAAAFTDGNRPSLLRKGFFAQVTREPLTRGSSPQMSFQHDLSGSLRVLAFYRVVSVSAQDVEGPWTSSPVVPFGVPSLGPPTQPMLEKIDPSPSDPPLADGSVRLRVRVLRGPQEVSAYRLRRSSVSGSDPRRMLVVTSGAITPTTGGDGPIEFDIDDDGSSPGGVSSGLRSFTRYAWRVEVQAPQLPGSTLPGEWSQPSAAVTAMLVPPAPVAATLTTATVELGDPTNKRVRLTWTHPGPLDGGTLGLYRFDVYRRLPGGAEARVASIQADKTQTTFSHDDPFASVDPPATTSYRIVALDPTGRMSPPSAPISIP